MENIPPVPLPDLYAKKLWTMTITGEAKAKCDSLLAPAFKC